MRGLKLKIDVFDKTFDDYESSLICLAETHLTTEVQIEIPGYRIHRYIEMIAQKNCKIGSTKK